MNSSNKQPKKTTQEVNKRSSDPFDKLIFEKGLRISQIMTNKKLNAMVVLLNNGYALNVPLTYFSRLKNATQDELNKWELSGNGTGIRWEDIDEDLSLKGLIKESAMTSILHRLEGKKDAELSIL
jgi:uncharacterized protein DUF2442